jgi:hypothetical protein
MPICDNAIYQHDDSRALFRLGAKIDSKQPTQQRSSSSDTIKTRCKQARKSKLEAKEHETSVIQNAMLPVSLIIIHQRIPYCYSTKD